METPVEEFIEWCRKERDDAVAVLPKFENGEMQLRTVGPNGDQDHSQSHAAHLRDVIEKMDAIIAKYENGKS